MIRSGFEAFGALAAVSATPIELSGRYALQADDERRVLPDVFAKLAPQPSHRLLDIGCGPGNLLIPLSFHVREAVGIDHPNTIERCRERYRGADISWIAGEFPATRIDGSFDRILAYSVIQYLAAMEAVFAFIDAAVDLLAPGGRVLIADLPNADRKARFLASEAGRSFQAEWRRRMAHAERAGPVSQAVEILSGTTSLGSFDDAQALAILARYRSAGLDAYLLPQPPGLPFGHTREDILLVRH